MKNSYKLTINSNPHDEALWLEVSQKGYEPLYGEEIEGKQFLFVKGPSDAIDALKAIEGIVAVEAVNLPDIDWHAQWREHAPGFTGNLLTVDLGSFGTIALEPGPGFGDLSHATTRMCLELMPKIVPGHDVIDIGCGSGVLSFAAEAMEAKSVTGVDIDDAALDHARHNAVLNSLPDIHFCRPEEMSPPNGPIVAIINMIRSEQAHASIPEQATALIVSGFLKEERQKYLDSMPDWLVEQELEEHGWCAFLLLKKS